jgi:hypothetical protein
LKCSGCYAREHLWPSDRRAGHCSIYGPGAVRPVRSAAPVTELVEDLDWQPVGLGLVYATLAGGNSANPTICVLSLGYALNPLQGLRRRRPLAAGARQYVFFCPAPSPPPCECLAVGYSTQCRPWRGRVRRFTGNRRSQQPPEATPCRVAMCCRRHESRSKIC